MLITSGPSPAEAWASAGTGAFCVEYATSRTPTCGYSESMKPWRLTDPPNAAVFTTRQIAERDTPCTVIIRDDDGDWQALGPGRRATEDSVLIDLEDLIELDPRLRDAVLELDSRGWGWKAEWNGRHWKFAEFSLAD